MCIRDRSRSAAARYLQVIALARIVEVTQGSAGGVIRLTPMCSKWDTLAKARANVQGVPIRSHDAGAAPAQGNFYGDHKADDAFQPYRYAYAIARRTAPTVLLPANLSAGCALAWDHLREHGDSTARDLAEEKGMSVTSARLLLNRLAAHGYADREREDRFGAPTVYTLRADAAQLLDARRPEMASYGLHDLRAWHGAKDAAKWAAWRVREGENERARQFWKGKAREETQRADQMAAHLLELGINPAAKVAPPRAPKTKEKGRAEAGTAAQWGAALARARRTAAASRPTAGSLEVELYWPEVERRGEEFNAWAAVDLQEPGWAVPKSRLDIVRHFKRFLSAEAAPLPMPTIHFAGGPQLAAAAD